MLDEKTERAVAAAAEQLRALYGTRLVAVAVYGSAAGADFVPGVSDVNLVVVLDELDVTHLSALQPHVSRWRKQGLATPLLIDEAFLREAADVFPMELYDIKDQHRMLFGTDIFAAMPVSGEHLRYACEHEARGKLLRLRQLYLEIGGDRRRLRALLLDSLKTFLIIMRNLNRLHGVHAAASYEAVLPTFAQRFDCALPVMSRLLRIKLAKESWGGDAEATFHAYVQELQSLIRVVDQIDCRGPAEAGR